MWRSNLEQTQIIKAESHDGTEWARMDGLLQGSSDNPLAEQEDAQIIMRWRYEKGNGTIQNVMKWLGVCRAAAIANNIF